MVTRCLIAEQCLNRIAAERSSEALTGEVGEYLMDDLGVVDGGDDLHRASAVGAGLELLSG